MDLHLIHDLELQRARDAWQGRAQREGIVCIDCLEVPALEHRHAFYDTGLCERCTETLAAA